MRCYRSKLLISLVHECLARTLFNTRCPTGWVCAERAVWHPHPPPSISRWMMVALACIVDKRYVSVWVEQVFRSGSAPPAVSRKSAVKQFVAPLYPVHVGTTVAHLSM